MVSLPKSTVCSMLERINKLKQSMLKSHWVARLELTGLKIDVLTLIFSQKWEVNTCVGEGVTSTVTGQKARAGVPQPWMKMRTEEVF